MPITKVVEWSLKGKDYTIFPQSLSITFMPKISNSHFKALTLITTSGLENETGLDSIKVASDVLTQALVAVAPQVFF